MSRIGFVLLGLATKTCEVHQTYFQNETKPYGTVKSSVRCSECNRSKHLKETITKQRFQRKNAVTFNGNNSASFFYLKYTAIQLF